MQCLGIIIHHSACPSINGKGYDYMVLTNGVIVSLPEPADSQYVHLCIEGDFSTKQERTTEQREQVFMAHKLLLRLLSIFQITEERVFSHCSTCPGGYFPWSQLVISSKDGYH
ncbi:N-acetylmuramoyl-L-alanine amidase [Paenibacillus sp. N1-5-1-14]|uniref:N-acetylmuramoyl-L-alanine amidase n=1 Tax=Paenibacillus radicibacter TaxID=2972488 RepID=UPI002159B543|nr:N-acetylmuramoyl-L-alanine amidase [Paenibacillus radicibacter]MCR8642337.1 N-acetylmuramoyl-L-alanine amidase [Paenibacillus radicibacter]